MNSHKPAEHNRPSPFPRTSDSVWETIGRAKQGDSIALGNLCVLYQKAIFLHVLRWEPNYHEAEDLTQKFLARMLEKNPFQRVEKRDTRFRSYLLRCLKNFLRDQWRQRVPCGEPLEEVPVEDTGSTIAPLDVALAWEIHAKVLEELKGFYAKSEVRHQRFQLLGPFLRDRESSYACHGPALEMNPGQLRKFVHDMREAHYDVYRSEVAQLVDRGELGDETRYLYGLWLAHPQPEHPKNTGIPHDFS